MASEDEFPASAAEELQHAGFTIIPGPIAVDLLAGFAAAYDAAMASGDAPDLKVASTTTRLYDFVNRGVEFDDLYLYPPLLRASHHAIGGSFKFSSILGRTLRPHTAAQDLHVDIKRDSEDLPMVGFILMVDEFRYGNGATRSVLVSPDETGDASAHQSARAICARSIGATSISQGFRGVPIAASVLARHNEPGTEMSVFCLVHGSAQGPTGWKLLVAELQARGHDCICVDLPTDQPDSSATEYARRIGESIVGADRPTVVAHSASGLFLPLVPDHAQVDRLVYLASVIPLPGESFLSQVQKHPTTYRPDFLRVKPPIDDAVAQHYLFHDCSPDVIPWALSTLRMMYAKQAIIEQCPLEKWPPVPSSYIFCSEDRTINPGWWEAAARERLHTDPIRMESGHAPHVSRPKALAEILDSLTRTVDCAKSRAKI
ncbi:MAG TPA: alpha/beta hydrolase [Bryobacteraceae bacterium]|nr:alpha/beta hydrolase [Bryobacteraceae bacterium]